MTNEAPTIDISMDPFIPLRKIRDDYGVDQFGYLTYEPDEDYPGNLSTINGVKFATIEEIERMVLEMYFNTHNADKHELALQGVVKLNANFPDYRYFYMMDMKSPYTPENIAELKKQWAIGGEAYFGESDGVHVFNSGRSMHLYGTKLHTQSMIRIHMMSGLIGATLDVDERWVGYALLRGFGSLRVTRVNVDRYQRAPVLTYPTSIDKILEEPAF